MGVLFDTSTVAAEDRPELWSRSAAEAFFPMSIQPLAHRPFRARLAGHELGPAGIARVTGDPNVCARTARDIAAGDPELLQVLILRRGRTRVEQDGRACEVADGDLAVYDSSRPFAVHARAPFDLLICGLPLALLGGDADRLRRLAGVRIPGASAVAGLFTSFVAGLADRLDDGPVGGVELELADTLASFCRALGREGAVGVDGASVQGARLREVKAWIEPRLGDPDLGPEAIAAANFVSTRYLHRLFEPEAVSVSAWIRSRRLEGCRRELADPALAGQTIATVARRWGFTDAARFSRRFREAYGCSPRDVRRGTAA